MSNRISDKMMEAGVLPLLLVVILPLPNQAIVPPKTPILTGFDPVPVGSSGASRTLTCDASQTDAGTVTYKWYRFSKNGQTGAENWESTGYFDKGSSITINIGSDKKADFTFSEPLADGGKNTGRELASGKYRCRANNSAGTVDSEWEDLYVYEPCSGYTVSTSNPKPAIGSIFTLSCTRKTASGFSVDWSMITDGASTLRSVASATTKDCEVDSGFPRCRLIGCNPSSHASAVDFKLQVTNAKTSDTGYWFCYDIAVGCKSNPIKVVVQDKPGIPQITGFPSVQVAAGTQLNLKCVASPPGDTYEWYKDGTKISTSITYDFEVKKTSAGKYKCIATNTKASTESREMTLSVKWSATELKMVESPTPSPSAPGSSVTIKCETDSSSTSSPGTIEWYRDGQNITSWATAGSRPVSDGSTIYTSVLTFTAKKVDNQAKYECKINDQAKFKKEVTLTVRWSATELKMTDKPTAPVIVNASITIKCETDSSNSGSQETISWYRNGQEITTGITPSTGTSATDKGTIYKSVLTFTAKKEDNQAKYECRIKDRPSIKKEVTITVYYKATSIAVSSVTSSSHAGEKAKFLCKAAGGNPTPTTTIFYKRSEGTAKEVIQGERVMAKEDNQGEYYCEAKVTNYPSLDVTSSMKTYTVTFPNTKIIFDGLSATPVKVGEQKTFTCGTDESNPVTDVEWHQNIGNSWTNVTTKAKSSERSGHYGGKIVTSEWTVQATKAMYRATVRCVSKYILTGHDFRTEADKMMNVEWSATELKMVEKPTPRVTLGSSVTIKCETDSATESPGTILWYKDGQQITSGITGSRSATDGGTIYESKLIFTPKKDDNQAKYECKINEQAEFKKNVTITVHFPPNGIQLSEASVTVKEGESKSITCSTTSSSNPAVSVSVKKRLGSTEVDVPVMPGITDGANHGKDASVVINLGTNRKDNVAQYICTFTFESSFFTKTVTVNVHFKPSKITLLQKPANPLTEGQPIIMICETDSANPAVDVLFHRKRTGGNWEAPTTGITYNDRKANEYNGKIRKGTLSVTANRLDNQAEFKCEVKGSSHLQHTATVAVYYPPTTSLSSSPKPVKEGDALTLTCKATGGNPTTYQYKWFYNTDDIHQQTAKVYKIANIQYTRSGRYRCQAVNYSPGGFAEDNIDIDILYKAKRDPKLSSVTSVASKMNQPASFTLHVIANPPVTDVIWFSSTNAFTTNGFTTNRINDTAYTFNKTSIELADYGNYTVNVTNTVGISTFEFQMKKAGKPHTPCCLRMVKVTLASVTLTFESKFAGGTVQTFTVEKRQKGDSSWEIAAKGILDPGFEEDVKTNIVGLGSSTNYEFRVQAVNEDGASGFGNVISVKTEDAPSVTLLTAKRKGTLVTISWPKLPKTYTKVKIEYCPIKGGSCRYHEVKDASQLQTSFSVDADQTYKYSLEIYEGKDVVFSSSAVEAEQPGPPVAMIGGAVGGVLFFLIIVVVILAVVFVMKKRRAEKDNAMLATTNGNPPASGQDNPGFNDVDGPDGFNPYESMELKTSPSTSVSIPMETSGNATYAQVNKPGKKKAPVGDTYAEVDFSKKKKGKKGAAPDATYAEVKKKKKDKKKSAGDTYAEVDFSKKKKGKEKKGSSGPADGPVYAEVNKKGKSPFVQPVGDEYAEVDFSKKAAKNSESQGTNGDVYAEVNKPKKPQKPPKPGQGGADTAVYANLPNGEEDLYADVRDPPPCPSEPEYKQPKQAYQVGVDGTIYSEVRIQPPKKPNVIIGQDSIDDPYASVDFSKEAPPLPAPEDPDDPDDPGFIQLI